MSTSQQERAILPLPADQRLMPNRFPHPAFTPPHTKLLNFSKSVGQSVGATMPHIRKKDLDFTPQGDKILDGSLLELLEISSLKK